MASTLPLIKEAVGTLPGSWIITLLRYEPMRKGEAAIGGSLHRAYACLVLALPIWGIGRAPAMARLWIGVVMAYAESDPNGQVQFRARTI